MDERLKRDLAIPLSYQIQLILSSRIKSGEYPLGSKMPNELDLSKEFNVSRPTIRKALDALEDAKMVKRIRPKGTFVSEKMDRAWFEQDSHGGTVRQKTEKLQVAMEEGLADYYLVNYFDGFTSLTGISVEMVHWNNWYAAIENIINKFVQKDMPDIFTVSNDSVGIFARMGVIRPLDEFIEQDKLSCIKKRCATYGLGSYVYNGKLYGYPFFSESRLLIYRKDHFQNAGIPDPGESPLTHDSFVEIGKKLSNPDGGLYAFAYPTSNEPYTLQSVMPWLIQRGGRLLRIENGRVVPATDEQAFIDALGWYTDLVLQYKICPPTPPTLSIRDISLMLMRGSVSMMVGTPNILRWLIETTPEGEMKYGLAPLPAGPDNHYAFMGGMPLCVSSTCKNPKAAWELVAHLTSHNILRTYCNRTGTLMPIECYDLEEIRANTQKNLHPVVDALESAVPHTYPVGYNQCLDFIRTGFWQIPMSQVLDLILRRELSVENAAKFLSVSIRSFSKQSEY